MPFGIKIANFLKNLVVGFLNTSRGDKESKMNRGLVIFSAILVFCASSIQSSHEDHPPYNEVNTNIPKHSDQKVCIDNGCVQGKVETGNDKAYEAFYGIPFALPPVGELRFKVCI